MIEAIDIWKTYRMGSVEVPALQGFTLCVNRGEFVALMGPSGSGKSTALHILGLLDRPDKGTYRLAGQSVAELSEKELSQMRDRLVGFVFQQYNLLPRLSAVENVSLPLLYSDTAVSVSPRKLLERVGLGDRLHHPPNKLSGGQQQRVAIARALVNRPSLLLADEPTGNLDSASAKEILALLRELHAEGLTLVLVTHDAEVASHAERIVQIRDGKIVSDQSSAHTSYVLPSPAATESTPQPAFWGRRLAEILALIREALRAMSAHKMRSFLSMLGVLIGTAAVIGVLALGSGAKKDVEEKIAALGANLLVLHPGRIEMRGVSLEAGTVSRLTLEDVEALRRDLPGVRDAVPIVQGSVQATFGGRNRRTRLLGTTPSYASVRNLPLIAGRFISEDDVASRARVAVLGATVARELFGPLNPIGQKMRVNRTAFEVVGVLDEVGLGGPMDPNDRIIIPVTTAMRRLLGRDYIDSIEVQAESSGWVSAVQTNAVEFLRKLKRISPEEPEPFRIFNMADMQRTITETSRTLALLLSSVGAISLLVGGIGIMNIMLVSVTERTREIGIRKAVGATPNDILVQFLVEALVVSLCGGGFGILLGWGVSRAISRMAGWPVSVTVTTIALSVLFSGAVGLIFGLWPARRASALQPVDALRYE